MKIMKFKSVKLYEVYVNNEATAYCFYEIDDVVDFVVTRLHQCNVDDELFTDAFSNADFHFKKVELQVYDPDVRIPGEEK